MANEITVIQDNGINGNVGMPIENYIAAFLNYTYSEKGRSEETVKTYRKSLNQFLKHTDVYEVNQFNAHVVNNFLNGLFERENYNTGKKISVRTFRLYRAVLMKFTKFLYDEGIIAKDFSGKFAEKRLSDQDYHARAALTCKDAKKLLRHFKNRVAEKRNEENLRNYAICRLMLSCGLRCIEVTRLTLDAIREENGVYFVGVIGKGKENPEDVRLPREVKVAIDAYLEVRKAPAAEKAMFVSCRGFRGNAIKTQAVNKFLKKAMAETGIIDGTVKDVDVYIAGVHKKIKRHNVDYYRKSAHSTRHFAAMEQVRQNVKLDWIRKNLRHSSLTTTSIYLNDDERLQNNGNDLVDSVFDDD